MPLLFDKRSLRFVVAERSRSRKTWHTGCCYLPLAVTMIIIHLLLLSWCFLRESVAWIKSVMR